MRRHKHSVDTEAQRLRRELLTMDPDSPEALSLRDKSPEELFILFDEDDSGLISYKEFRRMLPFLSVEISDAKALRYFKLCDTNDDDNIDIEEFRVALYICNPTTGNNVGYSPYKYLTPLDAFQTFDDQNIGLLDEDEFFFGLDYLGIKLSDEKQENLFNKYDTDKSGNIDYQEFREAFLETCDVKRELSDRGEAVPTFTRRKVLVDLLRPLLIEDEERERKALAGALRFKQWMYSVRETRRRIELAKSRATSELGAAMDLGGHVYVFGSGSNGQFKEPPRAELKTKSFLFEKVGVLNKLWRDRVYPEQLQERLHILNKIQEQAEETSGTAQGVKAEDSEDKNSFNSKYNINPYQSAIESPFQGLNVATNSAALWGKRVSQVAVSESVIFALSDTGDVYCWGGHELWWHELQPDSNKSEQRAQITPRSQLLLGTNKSASFYVETSFDFKEQMTPDEAYNDMVMVVTKYYEVWEPPPNPNFRKQFFEKELIPKVKYESIQFSLKVRGKVVEDGTKMELMMALYEDILLEKRLLGERAHKGLRELEEQTAKLIKRKKVKMADKFVRQIDELWRPLREVQAESRAEAKGKLLLREQSAAIRVENDYISWRRHLLAGREDMHPQFSPRGNSLEITLNGVTPRGPDLATPRGYAAVSQLAAGSSHACLIHQSGQLYSWGVGAAGRLGLDLAERGDPQADVMRPKLVQSLVGRPVIRVSCGYSHTGAVTAGGELFMFGSASTGKCGLGRVIETEECFCSVPTRVLVGAEDRRVLKVSCGSAHTACVSERGQLWVFGCGDGGRLGLGPSMYDTVFVPTLVHGLLHEHISSVSCGNSTTIALSEVKHEWRGTDASRMRVITGGRVYVAGSGNVLGKQSDSFTRLDIPANREITVKQVSAGFSHSALVTAEGELYCWGRNDSSCCAAPSVEIFIAQPRLVACLFEAPINIALGKKVHQSSVLNCRDANIAINGSTECGGEMDSSCTQMEPQPWWEVDLGDYARIDKINIWNRTDSPRDSNHPQNMYSKRLFPCWVLIGTHPFSSHCTEHAFKKNISNAQFKVKLTEENRLSVWKCPASARGRYVRIQLEGFNFLSICEVEIFGSMSYNTHGIARVSQAVAGKGVTVAVVRASVDPHDVEIGYKRAAYSDAENADILRQYETFALEYDKFGRGDLMTSMDCTVCVDGHLCETCMLLHQFHGDLKLMPTAIGGRRPTLQAISEYLLIPKYPPIELIPLPIKVRGSRWRETQRQMMLRLNPRNWLGLMLMESEREAALRLKPIELYEEVREELGIKDSEVFDEADFKIALRRRRLLAKKRRGKGVFVTNRELGATLPEDIPTVATHVTKLPYPRTVIKRNEVETEAYIEQNKVEVVNVKTLIEDENRRRLDARFFKSV